MVLIFQSKKCVNNHDSWVLEFGVILYFISLLYFLICISLFSTMKMYYIYNPKTHTNILFQSMLLLIFLIIIASTLSVFYIQESHQKRNSSCMNLTSASSRILLSLSETHKETNQSATLRRRCTQASQLLSSLHSCTVVLGWVLA